VILETTLHPDHPIKSDQTYTYLMGAWRPAWVALLVAPNSPLTDWVAPGNG